MTFQRLALCLLPLAISVSPAATAERPVTVAQMEAEIHIGRNGERIYVNPFTGEVVAIEPARRVHRDWNRRLPRDRYEPGSRQFREVPPERRERHYPGLEAPRRLRTLAPDIRDRSVERAPLPGPAVDAPARDQALADRPALDGRATGAVSRDLAPDDRQGAQQPLAASRMMVAKAQVLLDRAGASPGVIDGLNGSNMANALDTWRRMTGSALDVTDESRIDSQLAARGGPAFAEYRITNTDAAGPYVASVPSDYGDKARLDRLAYTSPAEAIAEKFHMDEAFLRWLNPEADFSRPGTVIQVAVPGMRVLANVARIEADKGREQVRAYDSAGRLVAAYPATIGSSDTPSPSGTVTVERIAFDPEYTYNPKINFRQGANDKILRIPPGPNGPVGSIWIALSKPTYGIHGTPEPSRIGKTNSHGCVRLTNWDADELARMVKPGVTVEFID